jgi:hypothetical protein
MEMAWHRHLGQRLDDLEDVFAGAEVAALSGDHDGTRTSDASERSRKR